MISRRAALASLLMTTACGGDAPEPATAAATPPSMTDAGPATPARGALPYPATAREATSDVLFGTKVDDPYRWLEDAKRPDVQAWMKAQDALSRSQLANLPERASMVARMKELFYVPVLDVPSTRGTRVFYWRQTPPQEKAACYWKDKADPKGVEHVLLDPNTLSADGSISVGDLSLSWDGKRAAYNVHHNNSDEATMEVMDVATSAKSAVDVLPGTKYAMASWTPKGDAFYYVFVPLDDGGKPIPTEARPGYAEVRRHVLGQDPKNDEVIRPKTGDPTSFSGVDLSEDGHWLRIETYHGWTRNDVYVRDMRKTPAGKAPLTTIIEGRDAHLNIDVYKDHLYAFSNDGAPNGRIVEIDPNKPSMDKWKELVPEAKDRTLRGFSIVGGKLALAYMKDVSTRLEIHSLDGKLENDIPLPALGTASGLNGRRGGKDAYYIFETYNYPSEIFHYDTESKKSDSFFKLNMPFDGSKFVVEQEWVTSKDGTRVPMFVVHGRDVQKTGHVPTLVYAYGGFGFSEEPTFTASVVPWLERGGVYIDASLRGGSEYGESWHRAGMRHDKQHVFDDAIAAAEGAIKLGWTDANHLVARGASNGGLLVGALVTERPDLFQVGLCGVPLLDMIRYDQFGSGKTWTDEYGTASKAEDFPSLLAYSPYHHVTAGTRYPAMLFLSADSDDRVDPMHARKLAASLQYASIGGPVLLRIEKNSGHGGADTLKSTIEERADEYAFAWAHMTH